MKRIISVSVVGLMTVGMVAIAQGNAGTIADPLATVSYVNEHVKDPIIDKVMADIEPIIQSEISEAITDFTSKLDADLLSDDKDVLAESLAEVFTSSNTGYSTDVYLGTHILTAKVGTKVILETGSAKSLGNIINLSTGATEPSGTPLKINMLYMYGNGSDGKIEITSTNARVRTDSLISDEPTRPARYEDYADALSSLDLLLGTNLGFELTRPALRSESLVMLIRLLGEEDEALTFKGTHPFTDVPEWLDPYVTYAYNKGYTAGTSATLFSPNLELTKEQYSTFLLRTLGYDDRNGDFSYNDAHNFAVSKNIMSSSDLSDMTRLYRDHMVYMSYNALNATVKSQTYTLAEKLISDGVFTSSEFQSAKNIAE